MRFCYFLLIIFFLSCKTKIKTIPVSKKDSLKQKVDTFNLRDLIKDPSLQHDIGLEEFEIKDKSGEANPIKFPKLSAKDFPAVKKVLDSFLKSEMIEMRETLKENPVAKDKGRWFVWLGPVCLYRDDKHLSFAFQGGQQFTSSSAGWHFYAINFDIRKNRQIFLGDYFILKTHEDSVRLGELITRTAQREHTLNEYIEINGQTSFCFDKENVYFLFDRYNVKGTDGVSSVKKKHILGYINPAYR
jgi:hypothetical protein